MNPPSAIRNVVINPWTTCIIAAMSMAQMNASAEMPQPQSAGAPPAFEVTLDSSYTFDGEAKFRGARFGDSDAFNVSIGLGARLKLNEQWSIPLDFQSQNVALGTLAGLPLPDDINTLAFGAGLAYRANDRWTFSARVSPSLYKFDDVGSNDIGISGMLMARWNYDPSLKFIFGLVASPDNEIPVLPLAGLDWTINEQWDLQLLFPKPRLIYSPDDKWQFYTGMNLLFGTTFRTEDALGTSIGLPQYNDALGSYSDIRVGCGVGYQFSRSCSLETEAGYSVRRQIDYTRIDEKVKFDPAPYVRIGLKVRF